MAFPNKKYFSLNEVSARWSRKIKDVEYCVENGLLDAYVKVCCVSLGDSSNPSLPQYEFRPVPICRRTFSTKAA